MYCEKCGKYSGKYALCKDCYYNVEEDDSFEEEIAGVLSCPICGKPTSIWYGNARKDKLCREHAAMLKSGEIELAPNGIWVEAKSQKKLSFTKKSNIEDDFADLPEWLRDNNQTKSKKQVHEEQENTQSIQSIIIEQGIKCITCGYETDGKLFCKKCYKKYSNKEIIIKIKNCKEIFPLDDFYEGYYECDDGHVVKSMAERDIDDYLFSNNIKHGYEIPIKVTTDDGKLITLHPDFCVFDENSKPLYYIEYWGYDDNNRDYTKTKKYKMPLYEKSGITLININAKTDLRNLKSNLSHKLKNFKHGIVNFKDE